MTSAILSGTKTIPGASQLRIRSVIAPLQKQIATNFAKEDANSEDVKMHLNVAGLVKAIQTNVLVSAKRPDEKKLELLLSQLSSICKNDKKFDEMKAKIVNLLGE